MNAIALALVIFAAVLHASWNFVSKKSGGGSSFVLLYETFAFLIYMPLLYLVDFKRLLSLPLELWLLIILSAVLHVIYTIVLQTGIEQHTYLILYLKRSLLFVQIVRTPRTPFAEAQASAHTSPAFASR